MAAMSSAARSVLGVAGGAGTQTCTLAASPAAKISGSHKPIQFRCTGPQKPSRRLWRSKLCPQELCLSLCHGVF